MRRWNLVAGFAFVSATTGWACGSVGDTAPEPVEFTATAYCLEGTTKSGVRVRPGIVAADPAVLPVGSVLEIEHPEAHAGIYTVLDTGSAIKGERLDIHVPDCGDAREFGRQPVSVRVLRRGWDPRPADDAVEEGTGDAR